MANLERTEFDRERYSPEMIARVDSILTELRRRSPGSQGRDVCRLNWDGNSYLFRKVGDRFIVTTDYRPDTRESVVGPTAQKLERLIRKMAAEKAAAAPDLATLRTQQNTLLDRVKELFAADPEVQRRAIEQLLEVIDNRLGQ